MLPRVLKNFLKNNNNNVFITIADRPLQSTINNSPNICHAGQYIIEHTQRIICYVHNTTHAVQHGNMGGFIVNSSQG